MGKNTSILMTLNRRANLASTLGHVISFFKDEPVAVPRLLFRDAINMGAVPVDETISIEPLAEEILPTQPTDPSERMDDIIEAIAAIVAVNSADEFTASGTPKTASISKRVGYKVDRTEILAAWNQRNIDIAAGNDA